MRGYPGCCQVVPRTGGVDGIKSSVHISVCHLSLVCQVIVCVHRSFDQRRNMAGTDQKICTQYSLRIVYCLHHWSVVLQMVKQGMTIVQNTVTSS